MAFKKILLIPNMFLIEGTYDQGSIKNAVNH